MSDRLRHAPLAYVRSMEMSSAQLFLFVEGKSDRSFYSALLQANSAAKRVKYKIILAKEVSSSATEGKPALSILFKQMRSQSKLISNLQGKRTIALFCFDKDIDDLLRRKLRSVHVMYTDHYTIENYLYRCGDLVKALMCTTDLDFESVEKHLGQDISIWRKKAVTNWADWVAFCLLARQERGVRIPNYSASSSEIHDSPYSGVDIARVQRLITIISSQKNLSTAEVNIIYERYKQRVGRMFSRQEYDRIFNGKWYAKFAFEDADKIAAGRDWSRQSFERVLESALLSTLNFQSIEFQRLHACIEKSINLLD